MPGDIFVANNPVLAQNYTQDTAGYANTWLLRLYQSEVALLLDYDNGWYIPSPKQLSVLFCSLPFIEPVLQQYGSTLIEDFYWSSGVINSLSAYGFNFGTGAFGLSNQSYYWKVRPIRSFTYPPVEYDTTLTYLWNTGDTTPYITPTPQTTTNYILTVTNEFGCQNTATQTILVAQNMPQTITDQVCQGEGYDANGFTLTPDETATPGLVTRTRTVTVGGCSSLVTLQLTVLSSDTNEVEVASCGPYNWHGQTYFQDGTYTQRFTSQSGCDSVEILHLTIHKGDTTFLSVDTCDGYQWFGQTYPYSGTYTHILQNQHGCDSLVILNLTVRDPEITYYTQTVCEAELPVTWHDITLDQAGAYTFYAVNAQGCDSVERLTLTVTPPVYTYQTITAYGYYEYEDSVWNTSGTHTIHYTAQNGCDSIVVLTLVILLPDPTYVDSTVCASALPLMWNGLLFTEAGQQTATLHPTPYYDSLVVMTLNVLPVPTTVIDTSVCELFVWNGMEYDDSGTYEQTFTAENGCDSVVTVHLSVFYSEMTEVDSLICPADLPFFWNGQTFTGPGQQTAHLLTTHQCDSMVIMTVTVGDTTAQWTDTTVCDRLNFHGTIYTTSGQYEQQLTNEDGCTYTHHIDVTVYQSDTTYLDTNVCNSSFPFVWHGLTFMNAGTKTLTLSSQHQCDSVLMLTVDRLNISISSFDTTVCGSFEWNGQTYTQSGNLSQILTAANGCDSVVFAHVTVQQGVEQFYDTTVCAADLPVWWRGHSFADADTLTVVHQTSQGCDSTEVFSLQVLPSPDTLYADTTVCAAALPLWWHGVHFTASGTQQTLVAVPNACDSVEVLTLQVIEMPELQVQMPALVAGTADTVAVTLSNEHFFPTYTLAVSGPWAAIWQDSLLVISPPADLAGSQQVIYTLILSDTNGCVTGTDVTASLFVSTQQDIFDTVLVEELPYQWQDTLLYAPSVLTAHLTSVHGVDSVVTLYLSVLYTYDTLFCNPPLPVVWHGCSFMGSGTQTVSYPVAVGADSIVTVSAAIGFVSDTTLWMTALENDLPVVVHGQSLDTTGMYVLSQTDGIGCESTLTLYLTVLYNVQVEVDTIICPNALPFTWNGKTFTEAGTQSAVLTAPNGVDSTVVMTVSLRPLPQVAITGPVLFCSETNVALTADSAYSYSWSTGAHTQTIQVTEVGTYTVTVANQYGCTATATHEVATQEIDSVVAINVFDICAGNTAYLTVGYHDTSTVQIGHGTSTLAVAETIFLPDGVSCPPFGCSYRSPVTFTDFTPGSTIQSVNDILYVRLNIEHSYIGDLYINITCPNGQRAHILRYGGSGTSECDNIIPAAATTWQSGSNMNVSTFFGMAYDEENLWFWNDCNQNASGNEPGTGWNYCWSNNTTAGYTYAPGAGSLIYRSQNAHNGRVDSSNVAAGTKFYHPDQSFANLIGCPLNGSWYIEVVDGWSGDNGYIFGWELALDPSLLPVSSNPITSATIEGPWIQSSTETSFTITPPIDLPHDSLATYIVHLFDDFGCSYDTSVTLPVHVPTSAIMDTVVLQNNLPLVVNGHSYTTPNTYTQHLTNGHGCDSLLTINLNVLYNVQTTADSSLCQADLPLVWNGKTFTGAGTQNALFTAANGVDSTVVMTVHLLPTSTTTLTAEVVENNLPYMLNGTAYNTTGTYTQHLTNAAGCDSAVTLNLTVYQNVSVSLDTTVCATALPYIWHGHTFTAAGTQTSHLTTSHGADSTVVCHLSADVLTTAVSEVTDILCYGATTGGAVATVTGGQAPLNCQWTNGAGATLASTTTLANQPAGTYTFTVTDQLGCVATGTATVNTLNEEMLPGTIGEDQNLCGTGPLDLFTGTMASGGDASQYQWQYSTDNLTWQAAPGTHDAQNYEYPDNATQHFSLRRAWISPNCGTVYSNELQVHVWDSYYDTITTTVCVDNPYQEHGFDIPASELAEPGNYVFEQLLTTGHCDSVIVLHLTVARDYTLLYEEEICEGAPYQRHGFTISAAETIGKDYLEKTRFLQTESGCDSIVELHLAIVDTALRIVSLTEDFCLYHTADLAVETQMPDYVWSTGDQNIPITVTETGLYSVTATQGNCTNTAEYKVVDCILQLYLPNAITPSNGDGLNDYFCIPEMTQFQIEDFEISIYNRWGEQVFYSRDKSFRWNGEVRDKLYHDNVYNYVIRCTNLNGRSYLFKGSLTVM